MKWILILGGALAGMWCALGQNPVAVPDSRVAKRRQAAEVAARAAGLKARPDPAPLDPDNPKGPSATPLEDAENEAQAVPRPAIVPTWPASFQSLRFFGYSRAEGGRLDRGFFHDGKRIYIVAAGDLIEERYRVVTIVPGSAVLEDMSNRRFETLPLSEAEPPGTAAASSAQNKPPAPNQRR